ncbi:hypothetical protein TrLO_g13355 [Triparma laevis f. longispina]|uniref:Uncharacterized protein n=1 Tax=Triparma laevis f. longispina TaxID=1714387 RepID=A0A9W7FHA0_9STRA|nr:hypothetical protein TrLO_g13355 [Triparma laevis f. longispina]
MPRGSKGRSRGSRKSWMDFSSVTAFLSNVATSTSSIFSVSESQNEYMNNGYNEKVKARLNATQINRQALPRPRIRLRNESPKGTPGLKSEQNDDLISASGSSRKLVEFVSDSGSSCSSFFSPRHSSQQRLVGGKFASSTNSTASSSSGDLEDAGCSFGGDESEVTRLRSNRAGTPVEVNTIDWITSKFSFRPETGSNPRPHSPNVDPNSVDAHPEVTQMIEIQKVALVEVADEIIAAQELVALKEEGMKRSVSEERT